MGVVSALFVILLSLSGFVIHHSTSLNLDQRFTGSPALLAWYGIEVPDFTINFNSNNHSVALIADTLYFDSRRLPGSFNNLVGLVSAEPGFIVALSDRLLLLTGEGELIEVLGSVHKLPQGIEAIGSNESGDIFLKVRGDKELVYANLDALSWTSVSDSQSGSIHWSVAETVSEELVQRNRSHYASTLLNWDRVILDIHSGRFLGSFGVVLVDIMALLFVLMAVSGVWIWSRHRS